MHARQLFYKVFKSLFTGLSTDFVDKPGRHLIQEMDYNAFID